MLDLGFSIALLLTFASVGLPVARLMPRRIFPWRMLAAPILGFVLVGVAAAIVYRHDGRIGSFIRLAFTIAAICGSTEAVLARTKFRSSYTVRDVVLIVGAALAVLLLILAPKWTGGARFAAFQGNIMDQLNYMTQVATYRAATFSEIPALSNHQPLIAVGSRLVNSRPAPQIILAAFSKALNLDTIETVYPYLASLQALTFFGLSFFIVQVFEVRIEVAIFSAAAGTLGFPMQYIFDINAWGKLAGMPVVLSGLALFLTAIMPGENTTKTGANFCRMASIFAIVVAGVIYFYPEMIPIYGSTVLGSLVTWVIITRRNSQIDLILPAVVGLIAGAATSLFFWGGTGGFLIHELTFANIKVDWWKYFQAYLLTRPTDFLTGAIGLYFILPSKQTTLPSFAALSWLLCAYVFTAALVTSAAVAWARAGISRSRPFLLLCGTILTLAVIAITTLAGRFWSAGEGLAMIAPVCFVLLISPLLLPNIPELFRLLALSFAGLYLVFGLARPICAANQTGVAYSSPYPGFQDKSRKLELDWDVGPLAAALQHCKNVTLDVDDVFLERYLAIYLTDHGRLWTSTHAALQKFIDYQLWARERQVSDAAVGDCILADGFYQTPPDRKIVTMFAKDPRLLAYLHGDKPALEIGVTTIAGIKVLGAYGVKSYSWGDVRWTSSNANFLIPNNPDAPTTAIELTAWPIAPRRHVAITINGEQVYSDLMPTVPIKLDVPNRSANVINIVIVTDQIRPKEDPRELGVAMRSILLLH